MLRDIDETIAILEDYKKGYCRSAWKKGIAEYAIDLLHEYSNNVKYYDTEEAKDVRQLEETLLNGAKDWKHYSWSGCSLCYDESIAKVLCTPLELKRTKNGALPPNKYEHWLDVQARALYQAFLLIKEVMSK